MENINWMIDFICREYGSTVKRQELEKLSCDQLDKLYNEAYRHSEWGL